MRILWTHGGAIFVIKGLLFKYSSTPPLHMVVVSWFPGLKFHSIKSIFASACTTYRMREDNVADEIRFVKSVFHVFITPCSSRQVRLSNRSVVVAPSRGRTAGP